MHNKLNCLERIIHNRWQIKGQAKKRLVEEQNGEIICEFYISTSGSYLLYKFENKNGQLEMPLLSDEKDVRKICDYVLFAVRRDILYAVMIELKKGYIDPLRPSQQILATEPLVEYLLKIANRICKQPLDKIKYGRIGVSSKRSKNRLRASKRSDWFPLYCENQKLSLEEILNNIG